MTEDTFEKAQMIKSRIHDLKKDLDWIGKIGRDDDRSKDVKMLASYSYTLVSNEIERLNNVFKSL